MSALVAVAFALPAVHPVEVPTAFAAHPATPTVTAPLHNDAEPPHAPEPEPGEPVLLSTVVVTGAPGPAYLPQWKSLTERA